MSEFWQDPIVELDLDDSGSQILMSSEIGKWVGDMILR